MADFPALPLWTDAYLSDTRHLSTLEHGAYLLLLMEAWRRPSRSLPDDDSLLARLAGLSIDEWVAIRDVVMSFWNRDGRKKTWTQKRLLKEHSYVVKKSQLQRDRIASRWKNKEKKDTTVLPDRYRTDTPTPTPTPTILSNDNIFGAKQKRRGSQMPEQFHPLLTESALAKIRHWSGKRMESEIEAFCDYHTAKGSIMKDWQAAFRIWIANSEKFSGGNNQNNRGSSRNRDSLVEAGFDALDQAARGRTEQ